MYSATDRPERAQRFCLESTMEVYVSHRIGLVTLERSALRGCAVALFLCALPATATATAAPVTPASLTNCGGHVSADPGATPSV